MNCRDRTLSIHTLETYEERLMKVKSIILLVTLASLLIGCTAQNPEKYHHRGFDMGAEFGDPAFKGSRVLGSATSVVVR